MARYGIGSGSRGGSVNAAPTAPGNGSGGAGTLGGVAAPGGISFAAAQRELSDVTTGRITLAMVDTALIVLIAFYVWTRSSQGG